MNTKRFVLLNLFTLALFLSHFSCNADTFRTAVEGGKGNGVFVIPSEKTIYLGKQDKLIALIDLTTSQNQNITWKSSDPSLVYVHPTGKKIRTAVNATVIMGMGLGTTTVTATTEEGGNSFSVKITVKPIPVAVTGVSVSPTSVALSVGYTSMLFASISPSNATNKNVTWKSDNPSVVTVDTNGKITAIGEGTATITVTTEDGGKTATANITTKVVPVTGVSIIPTSSSTNRIELSQGHSTYLEAVIQPNGASNKNVTWTVSPPIAGISVNSLGKVSVEKTVAINTTATIVVTTEDAQKTASAYLEVVEVGPKVMISLPFPSNGRIVFPVSLSNNFPSSFADRSKGIIWEKFSMAQTEITYKRWREIYNWATKSGGCQASGRGCYTFANKGREGNDGIDGAAPTAAKKEPVTGISWRDAIVWCNAYTEWYNDLRGGSLTPVYYTDGNYHSPLRTSTNNNLGMIPAEGSEDRPYIYSTSYNNTDMKYNTANGFRLPTSVEWEFAARWLGTNALPYAIHSGTNGVASGLTPNYYWTPGDYASGATKDHTDFDETNRVAWYKDNTSTTHEVATKAPNALGLYDMSGNVAEFCFDIVFAWSNLRVGHGGSWETSHHFLRIRYTTEVGTFNYGYGFRPVRSLP